MYCVQREVCIAYENGAGDFLILEFWCAALDMFPRLVGKVLHVFIPFATTYLYESGFSSDLSMKTKSRSRLNPEADLQIAVRKNVPYFDQIWNEKQE